MIVTYDASLFDPIKSRVYTLSSFSASILDENVWPLLILYCVSEVIISYAVVFILLAVHNGYHVIVDGAGPCVSPCSAWVR